MAIYKMPKPFLGAAKAEALCLYGFNATQGKYRFRFIKKLRL